MASTSVRASAVLAAALLGLAGCDGAPPADAGHPTMHTVGHAVGCGMVSPRRLAGLLGEDLVSDRSGSLERLRATGRPAGCRTQVRHDPARFVAVRVVRHPAPLALPEHACSAGWVYAGTPDHYAPACQQSRGGRSTTVLLARWREYVVRVTVGRRDRNWAGDPEVAFAMTEHVAALLGVDVPSQSASGSSS